MDILVFPGLGTACERSDRRSFLRCVVASAVLIPILAWWLPPGITSYRGLSGFDSALFAMPTMRLAVAGWRRRERLPLIIVAAAVGAFLAKTVLEVRSGSTLFVGCGSGGFVPVPLAHLEGALTGIACAAHTNRPHRPSRCLARFTSCYPAWRGLQSHHFSGVNWTVANLWQIPTLPLLAAGLSALMEPPSRTVFGVVIAPNRRHYKTTSLEEVDSMKG